MDNLDSAVVTVISVCAASSLIMMSGVEKLKKYIKYIVVLSILATVVMPLMVNVTDIDLHGFDMRAAYDGEEYKKAAQNAVVRQACAQIADELEERLKEEFGIDSMEIYLTADADDIANVRITSAVVYVADASDSERIRERLSSLLNTDEVTVIEQ